MTTAQTIKLSSIKHPLFRQTIGFDRFNELFETLATEPQHKSSFPPYDIIKMSDNDYHITMAVAGFSEADINITVENETLTISCTHADKKQAENTANNEVVYLHRGIAKRHFSQKFRLDDHMKVSAATMENGLLTLQLHREIPEEMKPQQIQINRGH
ncbi:MAG: Hsp20 family protein [Pseudomonadales bacterium]|nr:Hsp20 family protein [Pseudomonadales bacterium]